MNPIDGQISNKEIERRIDLQEQEIDTLLREQDSRQANAGASGRGPMRRLFDALHLNKAKKLSPPKRPL